jgi:hypothetical protein
VTWTPVVEAITAADKVSDHEAQTVELRQKSDETMSNGPSAVEQQMSRAAIRKNEQRE